MDDNVQSNTIQLPRVELDPKTRRELIISNMIKNLGRFGTRQGPVSLQDDMQKAQMNQQSMQMNQMQMQQMQQAQVEKKRIAEQRAAADAILNQSVKDDGTPMTPQDTYTKLYENGHLAAAKDMALMYKESHGTPLFPPEKDPLQGVGTTMREYAINHPGLKIGTPEFAAAYENHVLKIAQANAQKNVNKIDLGKAGPTAFQKTVDEKYAKDYLEWRGSGGYADVMKNLTQLKEVKQILQSGKDITGPVLGNMPEWMRSYVNPESQDAKDLVEEVVQRNLRLILGAQFTEREGVRLIARSYNPRLDEKTNERRLDRLIKQIEDAAKAKESAASYAEEHGTLIGFKGDNSAIDELKETIYSQNREAKKSESNNTQVPTAESPIVDIIKYVRGK